MPALLAAQSPAPAAAPKAKPAAAAKPAGAPKPAAAKPAPGAKPKPVTITPGTPVIGGAPKPAGKPILVVGSESLTQAEYEAIIESLPEQFRSQARGAQKRQFAENIVRMKVLAQEALKRKIDQRPQFQGQLAFQRENLLAGMLFQELSSTLPVDDAAVREYFEKNKGQYETVKARHILIRMKGSPVPVKPEQKDLTEEEALAKAQSIKKRLEGGEDFAAIAKVESDDAGSGANGGDLGTFGRGQMVPAFEQAALSQPVGVVGEPVKTQFGFHVIKVEARDAKKLEDVKSEIERRLRPELAQKKVEELRTGAGIKLDDAYFGPAAPPAGAAPAAPQP